MRLIDRLDRQQRESEDGSEEPADWGGFLKRDQDEGEDAATVDDETTTNEWAPDDPAGDPATSDDEDFEPRAGRFLAALTEEVEMPSSNGLDDTRAFAQPAAQPTRRPARTEPRPLREGLRKGLTEERVWLQAQREELEAELAAIEAQIRSEIEELDTQVGHIDALLEARSPEAAKGGSAWETPAPAYRAS